MKSMWCSLVVVPIVFVLLTGCGGGSSQGGTEERVGTLQGRVDLGGNDPANYEVFVDGQKTDVQVQADGTFVVPGVPLGEHVVDVISHSGMEAGRASVNVRAGAPTVIARPIQLEGAGQIVGFVVERLNGQEEPLEGVEVIARSDLPWILDTPGHSPRPAQNNPPLIYPPPPLAQYSAFTEGDGSYRIRGVAPGPYFVAVVVPGLTSGEAYVWVEVNRTAVADFVLRPVIEPGVGTVEGTVSGQDSAGNGTPLAGAQVMVELSNYWQPPPPPGPVPILGAAQGAKAPASDVPEPPDILVDTFRTLTDQNGHYSLNVPSGNAAMSVWAQGYEPQSRRITVEPNQTTVQDFLLRMFNEIIPPLKLMFSDNFDNELN